MNASQTDIENLAVRYHAFLKANAAADASGIVLWGKMLIETQRILGFDLLNEDHVKQTIESHEALLKNEALANKG